MNYLFHQGIFVIDCGGIGEPVLKVKKYGDIVFFCGFQRGGTRENIAGYNDIYLLVANYPVHYPVMVICIERVMHGRTLLEILCGFMNLKPRLSLGSFAHMKMRNMDLMPLRKVFEDIVVP